MREKAVADLVSDADVDAERAVAAVILGAYPDHLILGEELHKGAVDAERLWVVDPLDGTTNFAHRIPQFAVSIGFRRAGKPYCGVIFEPLRGEWYAAVAGRGAYSAGVPGWSDFDANPRLFDPPPAEAWVPARVGPQRRLDEVLIGFGNYYAADVRLASTLVTLASFVRVGCRGVRRMGAAALDLAALGIGRLGVFFEYRLSPWDFAAGELFVTEAGGRITTCGGAPLEPKLGSVLATNGLLHDAALDVLGAHFPACGEPTE